MKKMKIGIVAMLALIFVGCAGMHSGQTKQVNGSPMVISKETSNIFTEIDRTQTELNSAVRANRAGEVQELTKTLRDLADKLVQRTTLDTRPEVGATTQKIAQASKALDKAVDEGNRAEAQERLDELVQLEKKLKSQFMEMR
jgi:PBP1b-binding outer membrane lipoprotein LpoB